MIDLAKSKSHGMPSTTDKNAQKPAVLQVRKDSDEQNKEKTRDLRPAVFFKDLKERSVALEEEKSQNFLRLKKGKQPTSSENIKPEKDVVDIS